MKLSSKSEYAMLALIYLARQPDGVFISVESIAKAQGIPAKFLEQILLALKRNRTVRSVKGQRGGYMLGRLASEITLAEVIRLLDGALAPTESVSVYFYEPTPIEKEAGLVRIFRQIRDDISNRLEKTTIADVVGE